jgi:hypothetical protein
MKQLCIPVLASIIFLIACKKEQEVVNVLPKTSSNLLKVSIDKILNDSTILLRWDKSAIKNFKSYGLSRSARVMKDGVFTNVSELIKTYWSADSVTFLETSMPFANDITYTVTVVTDSGRIGGYGSVTYQRPNAYLQATVSDMLTDKSRKIIYLINKDNGTIISYDYAASKVLKSATLNTPLGYSSLGNYDGGTNNELYAPTSDGWLLILNTSDLTVKDKIYVGGTNVGSVVALNGKLFVSSSDLSFNLMDTKSLKVYNRATKQVITRTGVWSNTRIAVLDSANYKMVDVTFNLLPTDLNFYQFGADGSLVKTFPDAYHGDHDLDGNIIRVFPGGSKFITAGSGTVYTDSLKFQTSLTYPYSRQLIDFDFNNTGDIIYAAFSQEKKISAFFYPSAIVDQTFSTKLYPRKIFRDGNDLICVTTDNSYSNPICFIEKFKL